MEGIPDPTKRPRELREEFSRRVHEAITAGFNKAGRERITPVINRIMQERGVQITTNIEISVQQRNKEHAGKEFVWSELQPSALDSRGATDIREISQEVTQLILDEFNRIGRGEIVEQINALMDDYGRQVDMQVGIQYNVAVARVGPYEWPEIKSSDMRYREAGDR